MWSCASLIAMWCCYFGKVGMLHMMGLTVTEPSLDIIFSGVALGSGSNALTKFLNIIFKDE